MCRGDYPPTVALEALEALEEAFETFESLYLPHLIVAVAGQVRARGNVVILGLSPHGLLAITRYTGSRTTHRTKSDFFGPIARERAR